VTLPGIIEVFSEKTTGLENTNSPQSSSMVKYLKDGNLYIQTMDKTYNVLGAQVRK
jgi:hypothetical protein